MSATSRKFDFLWMARGSIALQPGTNDETALDRIGKMLESEWKRIDERGSDYVAFTGHSPMGWGGWTFNLYDRGVFWIERRMGAHELHYRLRCLGPFLLSLLATIAALTMVVNSGHIAFAPVPICLFMIWVYGGNRFLAGLRVGSLLERTVDPETERCG